MTYSFTTGTKTPNLILADPDWWAIALEPRDQIPGGAKLEPSGFKAVDAVTVTVGAAAAAATSIPVTATDATALMTVLIPSGTTLTFGGAKFATLTAPFMNGDTTLTVAPLAVAIAANDKGVFNGTGARIVPSGTFVGRTTAEMDSGAPFKLATAGNIATLTECYLLAFASKDLSETNDITLTRPGFVIKQNRLPGWSALDPLIQAKIRTIYTCTIGV